MAKITINEALVLMKSYRERHAELVQLRNENSHSTTRHYGVGGDKEKTTTPVYDVVALDTLVTKIATAIRKLELAIKHANAVLHVPDYEVDEAVLEATISVAKQ